MSRLPLLLTTLLCILFLAACGPQAEPEAPPGLPTVTGLPAQPAAPEGEVTPDLGSPVVPGEGYPAPEQGTPPEGYPDPTPTVDPYASP